MSEKLPQQPQNEEVDLGQLFNAIGKLFDKFFAFIGRIFKGIFSAFIYVLKPLVHHFKIVGIALVAAFIVGFIIEKTKKPIYFSDLIVKTHFDSKYQLKSDIDYFNALIGADNVEELSTIFEIDSASAKQLKVFELRAGPETQNDLFLEYDEYLQSVDTSLVNELSYVEYINNRGLLSGHIFTITAYSSKQNIFLDLTKGIKKTFENEYSKHQMQVRDTIAYIERQSLTTELSRLDSLQKTYLEVLKNDSQNKALSFAISSSIPLQQERSITKEYELFIKEQEIRRNLNEVNSLIAEENTYFDIISDFDKFGSYDKLLINRFYFKLPIFVLLLLTVGFLFIKFIRFIKNYE
ncbi:hypothetical protein [Winogradskyella rapida]|uniref:Polysaccharide chain length determinant N-terminal domain-containing protein n=1 Tax=Winogradskyella rapida TaxID=549701 RepID=A0ABW3KT40_9FLAO